MQKFWVQNTTKYFPPANEVCEGYVFTPVCQSLCSWGTPPSLQVHPQDQVHPPGPGTPPETRYTPRKVNPSPETRYTPWDQVHPTGPSTPPKQVSPRTRYTPEQCMLGDTGNKRVVRILLECILVKIFVLFYSFN